MEHTEFPNSFFDKYFKLFNVVFSPLLLISIIVFVIFNAEGIRINTDKNTIQQTGIIDIKDIDDASIYINNQLQGNTPYIYQSADTINTVNIRLEKSERRNWTKKLQLEAGLVKTFYPILYPNNLSFNSEEINVSATFNGKHNNFSNQTFFYIHENEPFLYKYSINRTLFGFTPVNEKLFNIEEVLEEIQTVSGNPIEFIQSEEEDTNETTTAENNTSNLDEMNQDSQEENAFPSEESDLNEPNKTILLKQFINNGSQIIPSPSEDRFLFIINNQSVGVVESNGELEIIQNIPTSDGTSFYWGLNNQNILSLDQDLGLTSYNLSNQTNFIIQRIQSDEVLNIEFIYNNGLFYTLNSPEGTFILQNNLEGTSQKIIDIPNVEGILNGNLEVVYDFLQDQNSIIIQSKKNIYFYNLITQNFRKVNNFPNEKVVLTNQGKDELLLTLNNDNPNQFRLYDMESIKPISTFKIEGDIGKSFPQQVKIFNNSQNLALEYKKKLVFIDIDGQNQVHKEFDFDINLLQAARANTDILIVILDKSSNRMLIENFKN